MGIDFRFEMRQDYLYVQIAGIFVSVDEVFKIYLKAQEAAETNAATKVLIDCLRLKGSPTMWDYYQFGEFVAEHRQGNALKRMTAYVGTAPTFDKGHFGELVATNRGANMKAFDRMEDALKWLGVEGEETSTI